MTVTDADLDAEAEQLASTIRVSTKKAFEMLAAGELDDHPVYVRLRAIVQLRKAAASLSSSPRQRRASGRLSATAIGPTPNASIEPSDNAPGWSRGRKRRPMKPSERIKELITELMSTPVGSDESQLMGPGWRTAVAVQAIVNYLDEQAAKETEREVVP